MSHSAHPRRPLALAVAISALALTLAGCSTPADSAPTPPPATAHPTTTAPPQATPTTTAAAEPSTPARTSVNPKIPAEATWDVVERFFAAYTSGLHTGDASRLRELSTDDCESCVNMIASIDKLKEDRIVGAGGRIRFGQSREIKSPHPDRFIWKADYTQERAEYEVAEQAKPYVTEGFSSVALIELTLTGATWRITGISGSAE